MKKPKTATITFTIVESRKFSRLDKTLATQGMTMFEVLGALEVLKKELLSRERPVEVEV